MLNIVLGLRRGMGRSFEVKKTPTKPDPQQDSHAFGILPQAKGIGV
jgi:hypothetical protein